MPLPNLNQKRHPSSFRDPNGSILACGESIIRGLSENGAVQYSDFKASSLCDLLESRKQIVATIDAEVIPSIEGYVKFIQHSKVAFISYPYEWPFLLLKDAALLHLSIQLEALTFNYVLIDASSYNIQFQGVRPIFIDILSFRKYQVGELWYGHHQFCIQFLNPLLLCALKGVPYHAWYRGAIEGLSSMMISKLLPLRAWLSIRLLTHVLLPARYEASKQNTSINREKIKQTKISKDVYRALLQQLYNWIADLEPKNGCCSTWENYAPSNQELIEKKSFIAEFSVKTQPQFLLDLGCNEGVFSEVALNNGTFLAVGIDSDIGALHKAVMRAKHKRLNFLPLYQDLSNQSPAQGWLLTELASLHSRARPDAIIALALIHHLVIGHNIPFVEAINSIIDLAPSGVIEFIPKTDLAIQQMLSLREDNFFAYSEENLLKILQERAVIIKSKIISVSGRCLYWYQKKQ